MNILTTEFANLYVIEPRVFGDARGYFFESFNKQIFAQKTGLEVDFVQDNESKSSYGVLRGLHFQKEPMAQAKLVRVVAGEVLDVVVDLRKNSQTFGKYFKIRLSAENKKQLFIPIGFAHGFVALQEGTVFLYKCTNFYSPANEGGLLYNDQTLAIDWEIDLQKALVSEKDQKNSIFNPSELYF